MSYCMKCGNELKENAKFCSCCGYKAKIEFADYEQPEDAKEVTQKESVNKNYKGVKGRIGKSVFASIGAILLIISGFRPLTRTNLGFWSGGEASYDLGIVFVIAGILAFVLVLFKAKKLFLIPAIIALIGALFLKTVLGLYGSFIEYTIWYYLIYVGIILLILQAFIKPDFKIKN